LIESTHPRSAVPATGAGDLDDTPERLLGAAAATFVEHGFRGATVREICHRAGANVAAVNYHFGGKEELYTAVLRRAYQESIERHDPRGGLPAGAPARERLLAFVRSFLWRILNESDSERLGRLMSREIMEPTAALDVLAERDVRPVARILEGIVREILGPGATAQTVRLSVLHIAGQCLFHHHSRPIIDRLFPEQTYTPADIEAVAAHITDFSLAGLRGLRSRSRPVKAGRRRGGKR
jgi:AcrR family transcriptional regulator